MTKRAALRLTACVSIFLSGTVAALLASGCAQSPAPATHPAAAPIASVPVPAPPAATVDERAVCPGLTEAFQSAGYPQKAAEQNFDNGTALVAFTIGTDGEISKAEVRQSSQPVFGEAALDVLAKLKCAPRSRPMRTQLPVTFNLPPLPCMKPTKTGSTTSFVQTDCARVTSILLCPNYDIVMSSIVLPPTVSHRDGFNGEVVMQFFIDTDGSVSDVTALTVTDPLFESIARRAIDRLRCSAQSKRVTVQQPFSFRTQ